MSALSFEKTRLDELEIVIQNGMRSFLSMGGALKEIRDNRYYKDVLNFDTFEEYCQDRWEMRGDYARKLIYSSETVNNLKSDTIVSLLPETESQTRPLTRLSPEDQKTVWMKVVNENGDHITAKVVEEKVKEFLQENYVEVLPEDEKSEDRRIVTYLNHKYIKKFDSYLEKHEIHEAEAAREFIKRGLDDEEKRVVQSI